MPDKENNVAKKVSALTDDIKELSVLFGQAEQWDLEVAGHMESWSTARQQ